MVAGVEGCAETAAANEVFGERRRSWRGNWTPQRQWQRRPHTSSVEPKTPMPKAGYGSSFGFVRGGTGLCQFRLLDHSRHLHFRTAVAAQTFFTSNSKAISFQRDLIGSNSLDQ